MDYKDSVLETQHRDVILPSSVWDTENGKGQLSFSFVPRPYP